MASAARQHEWFSAAELAEQRLPGVPHTKRKVTLRAKENAWGADPQKCRQVRVQGGLAYEYHVSLLPMSAQKELVKRGALTDQDNSNVETLQSKTNSAKWAAFEALPATRKADAAKRLAVIQAVEALVLLGTGKTRAIQIVGDEHGASPATINSWFSFIRGVAPCDRLAHLAPQTKGGGKKAEIDPDLWEMYRSDWLRFEKPTHAACYWRMKRVAEKRGLAIPHAKTFQKRLEAETPAHVIIACRNGREAVSQIVPAQIRSVKQLHAMHTVNIDGHRWDVRVLWPDGTISRPLMVGIQDVFSRKLLAWRVDQNETAFITRLVFADLFRDHGIPVGCVLDNGRAFASKWITGGATTRFRFKVNADDPQGLLTTLGVQTHWATPYHGQAKPIERYWRMVCNRIATGPDFAGAYTGNSTVAKPENYGSRAIPLADFERVIAREIAAINAQTGRRTEMARNAGKGADSFDQVFAASIAAGAPVGRATDAQMRLALLAAERLFADRKTGAITFAGNRYWAEGMVKYAGTRLTVRFDPENLHSSVFAYDADDRLIGELPIWEATGFHDVAGAKAQAKLVGDHRKAVKAAVAAEQLLDAAEIARRLADIGDIEGPDVAPQVLRPVRAGRDGGRIRSGRGGATAAVAAAPAADDFMDRFAKGFAASTPNSSPTLRLVE